MIYIIFLLDQYHNVFFVIHVVRFSMSLSGKVIKHLHNIRHWETDFNKKHQNIVHMLKFLRPVVMVDNLK